LATLTNVVPKHIQVIFGSVRLENFFAKVGTELAGSSAESAIDGCVCSIWSEDPDSWHLPLEVLTLAYVHVFRAILRRESLRPLRGDGGGWRLYTPALRGHPALTPACPTKPVAIDINVVVAVIGITVNVFVADIAVGVGIDAGHVPDIN
jgi:hypothetical protein